ncbi:hypothetical protein FOA52_011313 [Chlamydomonas sp. UWO 241]|nr:hypothetical protein FOA52_011313 [Chlamydomonas sp. UWO 241]
MHARMRLFTPSRTSCSHVARRGQQQRAGTLTVWSRGAVIATSVGGGGLSGGSNGGGGGGGGGPGEGCGPGGAATTPHVLSDVSVNEAAGELVEEVVLLDVGGMKCGGCVSHVKNVLESQPGVVRATVNLATETALVHVLVPRDSGGGGSETGAAAAAAVGAAAGAAVGAAAAGAEAAPAAAAAAGGKAATGGEQQQQTQQQTQRSSVLTDVGDALAAALTKAGFRSAPRSLAAAGGGRGKSSSDAAAAKRAAKEVRLAAVSRDLVFAWALSALSGLAHLAHAWAGAPGWLHYLHTPQLQAALSIAALLGPGRDIIVSGAASLMAGRPDMNTLVGLGATASFAVSCVAAALPHLGWKTFFEEPAMLLGFVLIGRALEEQAKLRASADMSALQELVPTRARAVLSTGGWVEVPADTVGAGDLIALLPGDRVPVDGVVVSGRSSVNESALTGEPLPVVVQEGSKVVAGTLNCDGAVTVRAEHSGQETVIADIVRMVEMAQVCAHGWR